MTRKRKLLLIALFAFLWIAVLWIAAELLLAAKAAYVQRTNRYVLATPFNGYCPDLDDNGNPLPSDDGIVEPPQKRPDKPIMPDENFGTFFMALDEEDRATSAQLKNAVIAIYNPDGTPKAVYAGKDGFWGVEDFFDLSKAAHMEQSYASASQKVLDTLRRTIETGKSAALPFKLEDPSIHLSLELLAYPAKDPATGSPEAVAIFRNIANRQTLTEIQAQMNDGMAARWVVPFFEYRKNIKTCGRWASNNVGFRDDDIILPKPPNVLRIACVGGSTTEEGRTNALIYPNLLEKMLNEDFRGAPTIDVANCGISGMDSSGEHKRALDYIALQPDLVIEYSGGNDLCHSMLPQWQANANPVKRLLRHSWVVAAFWPRLLIPPDEEIAQLFAQGSIQDFREMHRIYARHHIPMAICSFAAPDYPSLTPEERDYFQWDFRKNWQGYYFNVSDYCRIIAIYNAQLKRLCEQEDIPYIPVAEELRGGTQYFGDLCHLRPKGIQRKAAIICRYVELFVKSPLKETR